MGVFSDPALGQIGNFLVEYLNAGLGFGEFTCRLFQNDYLPVPGVVPGDLVEASFGGYSPVVMPGGEWFVDGPGPVPHVVEVYDFVEAVFTALATNTYTQRVYGYYLTLPTLGLVGAARFDQPVDVEPGATVRVQVRVSAQNRHA